MSNLTVVEGLEKFTVDNEEALMGIMPKDADFGKLKNSFISAVRNNPKVMECSPKSIIDTLRHSAQLGLETGAAEEFYIVPRKVHGKFIATFQMGYLGRIKMGIQSGILKDWKSEVVYQDDDFKVDLANNNVCHHIAGDKRTDPKGAYCLINLTTGGTIVKYLSKAQLDAKRSDSATDAYWKTGETSMMEKVVLLEGLRQLPKSKVKITPTTNVEPTSDDGVVYEPAMDSV